MKNLFFKNISKVNLTILAFIATTFFSPVFASNDTIHPWQKVEITLKAQNKYANPYTDVDVWVDLKGPGFNKRCYGFWDGDNIFKVRILATSPGKWSWTSGSNQKDKGLNAIKGTFTAIEWADAGKKANPNHRGFVKTSANGHAFEYADGSPCFILGDTWWSTATFRYKWYDDDIERPLGPEAGFKDYVRYRKNQGFNCIGMIAAFPNWANDKYPADIWVNEKEDVGIRAAWINQHPDNLKRPDGARAKDMHNEGGRAFLFPGKVPGYEDAYPDMDRINPEYFKYMDRKIDYLNANGFIPFIEVSRRDASTCWAKYHKWPDSYARYIQYIWSRYQANSCLYSPVHYDWVRMAVSTKQFNAAANMVIEKIGPMPFGTPISCNSSLSSLVNFGHLDNKWLTFHQIGNWREHEHYWYLTDIFNTDPPRPALNGEPYYAGYNDKMRVNYKYGAEGGTETDDLYVRSSMYGSFLSGGFAGHIYGAEAIWGADIEEGSDPPMWETFQWNSANQMQHLRTFALSEGKRYQQLIPDQSLVTPSQDTNTRAYVGWAYCARTKERDFFMAYFEKNWPGGVIRGAIPYKTYSAKWYDTRTGKWLPVNDGTLTADQWGRFVVPNRPSDNDWGIKLILK